MITICLVLVKMYGKSPIKLLIIINKNKEIIIRFIPLKFFIGIMVLISLLIKIINLVQIQFKRDGINQNVLGIKVIINKILNQFNDKILVDGSKDENKFVIIFRKSIFF